MKRVLGVLGAVLFGLSGCAVQQPAPTAVESTLQTAIDAAEQRERAAAEPQPPEAIMNELMPTLASPAVQAEVSQSQRFRISAQDVEAKQFFASLVADTPYSVALHPEVSGTLSLDLKDVTLEEVLAAVSDLYGYDIQRRGRVYQIYPAGLRTETFVLNYLMMSREAMSQIQVSTARLTKGNDNGSSGDDNSSGSTGGNDINGTRIDSTSSSDYWGELKLVLLELLGNQPGRSVSISPQSGLVTVRAFPDELRAVRQFLNASEEHLQRQVILEARILEVSLRDGYQQGIQWEKLSTGDVLKSFTGSAGTAGDAISQSLGGLTTLVMNVGSFDATINLLSTQGDVEVLSSPRVSAMNNQKAVIKVGRDEYYVTDISTTTVTGNATTTTPDVELTPFFSGVSLDVLPQIDGRGNVTMHVRPSVSKVDEQNKTIKISDSALELPLAQSELRETDTLVRARSGEVVVIGGLMTTDTREAVSKVPVLGDIPGVGKLFQSRSQQTEKLELVILLKPTVVGVSTWRQEMERSRDLLRDWYPQTSLEL